MTRKTGLHSGNETPPARDTTKLRRAAEALRESEQRFQAALRASPNIILALGPDGRILEFNPEAERFYGCTREEVLGKNYLELMLPESVRESVSADIKKVLAGEPTRNFENAVRTRDGGERIVAWNVDRILDARDRPAGIIAVGQDVTDFRKAQAKHRSYLSFLESLERVNRAIRKADNLEKMMADVLDTVLSIFGSDRAWLLFPCDPEAPSWSVPMERTRETYPGAHSRGVAVPMMPEARDVFQAAVASDGPVAYDAQSGRPLPRDAARRFSIRSQIVMALYPKLGKPWIFGMHQCSQPRVWTNEDITLFNEIGRRVADALTGMLFLKNLQDSEEKLRCTLAAMDDFVFNLDRDGLLCDYFHLPGKGDVDPPPELYRGKSIKDMFPLSVAAEFDAAIASVTAFGAARQVECQAEIGGKHRWFSVKVSLRKDPSGGFAGVTVVARDMTARRQAEETLRESESKYRLLLENADEAIFIAQDGAIKFPNRATERISGYSCEELVRIPFLDLVHPEDRNAVGENQRMRLQGEEPSGMLSFRMENKAGHELWAQLNTVLITWEGRRATLNFIRDITPQKKLEQPFFAARKMEAVAEAASAVVGGEQPGGAETVTPVEDEEQGVNSTSK